MRMIKCPICKTEIPWNCEKCPKCGTEFEVDETDEIEIKEKSYEESKGKPGLVLVSMPVTTCDIKEDYEIIGPVYYQITNNSDGTFDKKYADYIAYIYNMQSKGALSSRKGMWMLRNWVTDDDLDSAFFIATEELKRRAQTIGGNAIIGMKQDFHIITVNDKIGFYLQMYGTAVKLKQ